MGPMCVEHDLPVRRVFVRGRPFTPKLAPFDWRLTSAGAAFAPSVRRGSERAVAARSLR
jgi:hypothetical protein